jgi:predicted ATPase with chaperone activity
MAERSEQMFGADVVGGTRIEELGVRRSLVEGLTLKMLFHLGEATVQELAQHMCTPFFLIEGIFQRLRKEQLCQVVGMSVGVHRVTLTSAGRARAAELMGVDQYVGPVPVSFEAYLERVRSQSVRDIAVVPSEVKETFKEIVLDEETLAQLGTAVVSGRAIFLYGPPGTGKTTVAEHLAEIFRRDTVWVPYAVEVDGQIITVYDSHVHEPVDGTAPPGGDTRWVRCRRPRLMVGGELTIDMLDLQFNPVTRFYTAPVQMRANNGFLIVDDFGRQRIPAADLLNRWVVPLDRRVDFLTMAGGKKLQIPFDLFVVFATNLDPATVVEEAFLRRIQTKINLGKLTIPQFHEIFRTVCKASGVDYQHELVDDLIQRVQSEYGHPLRACYPRDIVNQILWRARYEGREPKMTLDSLHDACRAYFLVRGDQDPHTGHIVRR